MTGPTPQQAAAPLPHVSLMPDTRPSDRTTTAGFGAVRTSLLGSIFANGTHQTDRYLPPGDSPKALVQPKDPFWPPIIGHCVIT
jgi:hypothetical protein